MGDYVTNLVDVLALIALADSLAKISKNQMDIDNCT